MENQFNDIEVEPVKCSTCKHYLKGFKCKAYDLIPDDIFSEKVEHDKVMKDQKGDFVYSQKRTRLL